MAVLVDTSAVVLETVEGTPVVMASADGNPIGVAAVADTLEEEEQEEAGEEEREHRLVSSRMKAPHISTLYEKQDVMVKHFGVTQKQALRTQALLRLGVTEEDVRIAERLMGSRKEGADNSVSLEGKCQITFSEIAYCRGARSVTAFRRLVDTSSAEYNGTLLVYP